MGLSMSGEGLLGSGHYKAEDGTSAPAVTPSLAQCLTSWGHIRAAVTLAQGGWPGLGPGGSGL